MSLGANNIYASVRSAKSGTGNLLKAFLLLLIAVMVAVSCEKNDQLPEGQIPVKVSVNASSAKSLTKVALNDDLGMRWQSGDKLSVVAATSEGAAASSVLTLKEGGNSSTALFEGTLDISEIPSNCCFVYPAYVQDKGTGCISVDVATGIVTFSYGGQSGEHNPYMASDAVAYNSSGINATLQHIGGVLAVTLPDGVANITFQGNNGEKLSEYKYDIKTGTGEIDGNAAQSFSVAVDAAGLCYINVPPVKFEKGFTLLLQGTDGKVMYKSFNYSGGCDFSTAPAQGEQVTSACLKGALIELSVDSFEPYGLTSSEVSWSHTYDGAGALTGTKIEVSGVALNGAPNSLVTSYVAELKNSSGTVVRHYSGSSVAAGTHTLPVANDWPYLPKGEYTLELSVTTIYGTASLNKSITVGQPKLAATVSALTSYSYYTGDGVAKNVDQANNCDNGTIYSISTEIKISSEILNNGNYSKPVLNSFKLDDGDYAVGSGTVSGNAYRFTGLNATGQSWDSHNFIASFTFDGVKVEASRGVEITGLPYAANPPKSSEWSRSGGGYWENDYAQLSAGGGSATIAKGDFHIPSEIKVNISSKFAVHNAPIGTTLTVNLGTQALFSGSIDTAYFSYKTKEYDENANATMTSGNKTISIENSYGLGDTWGRVYNVNVKYASF